MVLLETEKCYNALQICDDSFSATCCYDSFSLRYHLLDRGTLSYLVERTSIKKSHGPSGLCFRSLTDTIANKSFALIKMSWLLFHPDCMSLGRSCYHCGEFKEWADFHRLRHGRGGRMSICAPCKNEQRRIVRRLREIHPLPIACEGCGEIGGKLQLDHDHTNDQFRAYLCCSCNLAVRRGRWARTRKCSS